MAQDLVRFPSLPECAEMEYDKWVDMGRAAARIKGKVEDDYQRFLVKWWEVSVAHIAHGQKMAAAKEIFGEAFRTILNITSAMKAVEKFDVPESTPLYVIREIASAPSALKEEVLDRIREGKPLPNRDVLREEVKAAKEVLGLTPAPKPQTPLQIISGLLSEQSLCKLAEAIESDPLGFMVWTTKFLAKPSQFDKPDHSISSSMLVQDAQSHVGAMDTEPEDVAEPFPDELADMQNQAAQIYAETGSERKVAERMNISRHAAGRLISAVHAQKRVSK